MAGKLTPISQQDFSGGMNAVSSPFNLGPKQLILARNMQLDEHGALTTRDGYELITTSPWVSFPIRYIGVLNKDDGTSTRYALQFGGVSNELWNTNTTPWTPIGSTLTNERIPQAVTAVGQEIIANGYEIPWIFNGSTMTQIAGGTGPTPLGAKHVAFHLGSLWLWNTAATTSSLDGPSALRMSSANDPNDWPSSFQTFISKDDGQVGMGMTSFTIAESGISPSQTLVLFKNYSGYQITGVFESGSFSIQRIKSDMGCIAPRTIQFVSGFGVVRLTHKGVALFNGVEDRLISEEIRPYLFGHGSIVGLDPANVAYSWAVQSQNPPLYILAVPTNSPALNRILIYDLVRKSWTICDFPVSFASLNLIATPTTFPVVYGGTNDNGQLVTLFNGATDDEGDLISWDINTRYFFQGSFMRPTFWRRLVLDLEFSPDQAVDIDLTLLGHSNQVVGTRTLTGYPGTRPDRRTDIDIMRVAPAITAQLSGTGNIVLRGLEWQVRGKPLTKGNARG